MFASCSNRLSATVDAGVPLQPSEALDWAGRKLPEWVANYGVQGRFVVLAPGPRGFLRSEVQVGSEHEVMMIVLLRWTDLGSESYLIEYEGLHCEADAGWLPLGAWQVQRAPSGTLVQSGPVFVH